jgi:hypothetical protein
MKKTSPAFFCGACDFVISIQDILSAGSHARCFRAFTALSDFVFDCLAFLKRPVTFHRYVGMMDKNLCATVIRDDKTKPFT